MLPAVSCWAVARGCGDFLIERTFAMQIQQIHHVAYRCKDAQETVEF